MRPTLGDLLAEDLAVMDARDGARHLYRAAEREQFYRKAVLRSVTTPAGEHFEALKG